MLFCKYDPHCKLSLLVKEIVFLVSKDCKSFNNKNTLCMPTEYPTLVIHIGPPPFLIKETSKIKLPNLFFLGLLPDSNRLILDNQLNTVIIKFQPTGLFHLFNVPMKQLCKMYYLDANSFLNFKADNLIECLKNTSGREEQKKIIDQFLFEQLGDRIPDFDFVENCIKSISSLSGNINIEKLIEISGVSARTFRDRFLKKVGIPAKTFARIKRINKVLELLSSSTDCKWQDIIYSSGFYDQPHFIREFVSMTGNSPSSFTDLNIPLILKISGK